MLKKKNVSRLIVVLAVTIAFVLIINIALESILKNYISTELDLISEEKEYVLGIDDVDINIFRGNISITDFYAKPNELFFTSFAKGGTNEDALKQVYVSKVSLSGLRLFDLIINRELLLDRIEIDTLNFNFYRPHKDYQVKVATKEKRSTFSLDSIHLSGIDKIDLAEMEIADYGIHVIDASKMDTISAYQGKEFLFSGLDMDAIEGGKGYFTFDNSELELELKQQEFDLEGGLYAVSFDDLHYIYNKQEILLINFELKPKASPAEFAFKFNQVYDINSAFVDTLLISGIETQSLFRSGIIGIQQIDVNGLKASILKDKTKPWNIEKTSNLPQMALDNMRQPLYVNTVRLNNSTFIYSEKLDDTEDLMTVSFENIQGKISNITSIRGNHNDKKSLDIELSADLLNILPFAVNITMPYNTKDYSFNATGYTKGTAEFDILNATIFPAVGMKFENGSLDGMDFHIWANNTASSGKLTMLYEDLEVEIFKEDESENKKVSWIANTFVKKSNPSKRGRTIVAEIEFERVKYRGFGHFLWKSIQSGIVNSLVPFGKRKKKENRPQSD